MSSKDANLELIEAIEGGYPRDVASLLAAGADPNYFAKAGGAAVRMVILVQKGTIALDPYRKPALAVAAHVGNLEVLNLLLGAGATVNAVDELGWTPLMFAAQQGRPEIVSAIIAAGANTAHTCQVGSPQGSALGLVTEDNAEVVELLLKHPADPAALQYVFVHAGGYFSASVGMPDADTTLQIARLALVAGADVNGVAEKHGVMQAAIDRSIRTRNVGFTKFLLESGASVEADGGARLIDAVCTHHPDGEMVTLLSQFGAVATPDALDRVFTQQREDSLALAVLQNFAANGVDYKARDYEIKLSNGRRASLPFLEALVRTDCLPRSVEFAFTVMGEDLYAKTKTGTPILSVAKPQNKAVILTLRADGRVREAVGVADTDQSPVDCEIMARRSMGMAPL